MSAPAVRNSPPDAERPSEEAAPARRLTALARRGFRSRGLAVAALALFALAAGAAAIAPWLFSLSALHDAIAGQLQASSGLYIASRGRPRFALAPQPHISIEGVTFADRNGALVIDADQLHGVLNLLPLAAGRLEVGALALVRPRVSIDLDRLPIDAPGVAARAAAAAPASPEARKADNLRLGVVAIVDGALRIRRGGRDHLAEKINASMDWRRIGEAATLSGAFDWRGERLEAWLWIAQPAALLRGEQSVATASLSGESLRADARGLAHGGPNARFSGRVSGSAASARDALRLFSVAVPLPGRFGDAQFSAQATLGSHEAQFQDLRLFVDGNEFEGAATLRAEDDRPSLTAALKSGFLSLKPMLADAPPLASSDGQWSRDDFELPDVFGADVDLRLDAAHARLGRFAVDDAALSVKLRDGLLDVALTQAQAYRGRMKARAEFRPASGGLAVHATAQTTGVDAGALLWDAYGGHVIAGALDSAATLDAAGANMAALMRSLGGRVSLTLADGEIEGVDFDRALRGLEKRPLASAQDIRTGRSMLQSANATISIEKGVGAIENGVARGPGFSLAYAGALNFGERSLALGAIAQEADDHGAPRENGLRISFDLAGPWDELTLTPDAKAFIRRSGAAAPLLPGVSAPQKDAPRAP